MENGEASNLLVSPTEVLIDTTDHDAGMPLRQALTSSFHHMQQQKGCTLRHAETFMAGSSSLCLANT